MIVIDQIVEYPAAMTTDKGLPGTRWSHLFSTLAGPEGERELLAFAERIGLYWRWIQKPGKPNVHFDCTPYMRKKAVLAGALTVQSRLYARAKLAGPEALATYLAAPEHIRLDIQPPAPLLSYTEFELG